jgi:hypothetical protein
MMTPTVREVVPRLEPTARDPFLDEMNPQPAANSAAEPDRAAAPACRDARGMAVRARRPPTRADLRVALL